jgi:hypothetical protein
MFFSSDYATVGLAVALEPKTILLGFFHKRSSDRPLLAKLVPIFAGRGCHVVSAMDLRGR